MYIFYQIVGKGENKPDKKKLKMDRNTHEQEFKDGFVKIKGEFHFNELKTIKIR